MKRAFGADLPSAPSGALTQLVGPSCHPAQPAPVSWGDNYRSEGTDDTSEMSKETHRAVGAQQGRPEGTPGTLPLWGHPAGRTYPSTMTVRMRVLRRAWRTPASAASAGSA